MTQLWKRYEALTHKMGHVLEARRAKGNFYGLETETYYSDFYDAFLKAVDGLLTVGRGQRIGIFAGSGVGKSSLVNEILYKSLANI